MNARVFIYWVIVSIPLGWGVYQSVMKSLPLFGMGIPAAATTPATPVTATGNTTAAPTPSTATPAATPMQTVASPAPLSEASPTPAK